MCNRDGERPPSLVAEGRGETRKRDAKYGAPCCRFRPRSFDRRKDSIAAPSVQAFVFVAQRLQSALAWSQLRSVVPPEGGEDGAGD